MSTFGGILSIARSAISAHQTAIQVTSHNIANAETPGYSRQRALLQEGWPAHLRDGILGTGVFVTDVTQLRDTLLDQSFRRDSSSAAGFGLRRDLLGQVEQIFHEPSENGLGATLDAFWNAWSDLSNSPDNDVARKLVQQRGAQVASAIQNHASRLDQVKGDAIARLDQSVGQLNQFADQVAELNRQIVSAEAGGNTAGDLRDARNRVLDSMSKLASIQVIQQRDGGVAVVVANQTLVDGSDARTITPGGNPPAMQVGFAGSADSIRDIGGEIQASLDLVNNDLARTRGRLDELARGIVGAVNSIHGGGWSPGAGETEPLPPGWAGSNVDFFTGSDAGSIALSAAVASDPGMIASGTVFGGTNDNSVALQMARLRDTTVTIGNPPASATIASYYRDTVTELALRTSTATSGSLAHETLAAQAEVRRQSVSGVSTDEELVQLMRSQQAYVAATRLVSVVDEMAQALLNMI